MRILFLRIILMTIIKLLCLYYNIFSKQLRKYNKLQAPYFYSTYSIIFTYCIALKTKMNALFCLTQKIVSMRIKNMHTLIMNNVVILYYVNLAKMELCFQEFCSLCDSQFSTRNNCRIWKAEKKQQPCVGLSGQFWIRCCQPELSLLCLKYSSDFLDF